MDHALSEKARELSSVQLFAGLDAPRLEALAALCQPLAKAEGELVIEEGEAADSILILLAGEVRVQKELRLPQLNLKEHEQRTLTRLAGADRPVLGETALLGVGRRRSSVVCLSACRLYRLDAAQLMRLIETDAATGYAIFRQLSALLYKRLETANMDVVKLSAALVFALEE